MTDKPGRRNDLLTKLLAMRDLPWTPEPEPPLPNHALRLSPAQIDAVRQALTSEVRDWLDDRSLATKSFDAMTPSERDDVHGAACNALMNAAPIVRSYTAQQGQGPYPVWIAGIEGVYLLMTPQHDTLGPFSTLAAAVDAMDRHHGPFLVGD